MIARGELPDCFFARYVDVLGKSDQEKPTYTSLFEKIPSAVVQRTCNAAGVRFTNCAEGKAMLLQKLLPIRLAQIAVQVQVDRHNFLSEQGAIVFDAHSIVKVARGKQRLYGVVLYPLVFFDLQEGGTSYKLTLAYRLDDGTYARHLDIVGALYKAPEEKREPVGDLVASTWMPVNIDADGKILDDNLYLLDMVKGHGPVEETLDAKKLMDKAQEVVANGLIEQVMDHLQLCTSVDS